MARKPDPQEQELFQLAQRLGEVDIHEMPEEEAPVVDWTAPVPEHAPIPEDTFQKAHDELTAILQRFQATMEWPKWQEPWWKQREKVLQGYGMTVDGFYAELRRRSEAKRKT